MNIAAALRLEKPLGIVSKTVGLVRRLDMISQEGMTACPRPPRSPALADSFMSN